ncbi:MAG: ATP-binding protein [Candidatus Fraserbacteria bacterium RBG_16_55_9]|uniref:ATP-binding protein n=1 Tax=Fraserbacteria sp. (strain RBG_16_55_9) TaxID=1817864 RepID=A0A1F5UYU5_FRAXR|nr:MAG: ATP-binding protein [Candidatus Fraserbacteria bacterium RBG_16_55_9]
MDPRPEIIARRLAKIKTIIAVAGGKGGVGKSTVATILALILREQFHRVGLLDLDFYGPSAHVILWIPGGAQPREEKGIIPPEVHGLQFMSLVYYSGGRPSPLRGPDVSNAFIELLAITRWDDLDFLIVDMPPGLGDTTLDAIRWLTKARFLVVSTPSRVSLETVKKLLALLTELGAPIIGIIENMRRDGDPLSQDHLGAFKVPLLGGLPFDPELERSLGNPGQLMGTALAQALNRIVLEAKIE